MLAQIDLIVRGSLIEFVDEVVRSSWRGREREAISLYAFGFLQRQINGSRILTDAT